jgi:hypothetical protein
VEICGINFHLPLYYSSILCEIHHNFFSAYFPVTSLRLSLVSGVYITVVSGGGLESGTHVQAGWNTSTVTLRVVRGDEKGTQCPEV